ncbi:alpha-1A adrenergic receptor-like isoform X1 [Pecten maximus]|uniref:alpha-1A adrenergic receptor-like isoform X1 n=1 Tax=Pecten maximus TaxID=6579 RepID=UPI001458C2D8|nr:alpha-1A adrenergic receptor-like isoform X1 [Pecten maximus]
MTTMNASTSMAAIDDTNSDLFNSTSCVIQQEQHDSSLESVVLLGMVFSMMSFIIIVGNIFVLIVVTKLPKPRQPTRILVMNLAVADLGLGICILPLTSYNEIVSWPFGEKLCILYDVGDTLLCIASLYTLCALAVDRYIGVTRPLRYNVIMTDRMAIVMVIMVWLLSWGVSCPPLFGWRQPPPAYQTVCVITSNVYYVIESCILGFFVPSIVVMCIYTKIYLVARKHISNISKNTIILNIDKDSDNESRYGSCFSLCISGSSNESGVTVVTSNCQNQAILLKKIRMELRAAKTFGKVLGIFVICWMPFILLYPFGFLCSSCVIPEVAWDVAFWLGYANSMMNPFVYALSCPEYRRAFVRLIRCRGTRDSQVSASPCVTRRTDVNVSSGKF